MNVAIVVPWRPGDQQRERNWEWARPWWERFGWPIFEVEHSGDAPFERSWCINEGARRAWPWDVLVVVDADVFEEDPAQVTSGVESAAETGRLTIPHTTGTDLSERGTRSLLIGQNGWQRSVVKRREVCTSRVWIMRRDLFAAVGGFDERFKGWGHEDVAAFHAMRTLRGCDQFPGVCYHLFHKPSVATARRTVEWEEGHALADRYLAADRQGWPAIQPILAERTPAERWELPEGDEPPPRRDGPVYAPAKTRPVKVRPVEKLERSVDVIVLTAGRQEYLIQTLASFSERVRGPIRHRTIQDDSGDEDFGFWLKETYPEWEVITTRGKSGFTEAIRSVWAYEQRRAVSPSPYIFHLEEDFTFDRDVDLIEMIRVLESDEKLAQIALLRGPFFPPEHAAGSIINEDPKAYTPRSIGRIKWLEHTKFFTTNPSLYRRRLLRLGWPRVRNSETVYTRQLVRRGYHFGYLGEGEAWVSHIGHERTMLGY